MAALDRAVPMTSLPQLPELPRQIDPALTPFERPVAGVALALVYIGLMCAVPVRLAYLVAAWLEPVVTAVALAPFGEAVVELLAPVVALLAGPYGLVTLATYSLIWALPVVLLIAVATAIGEETGLHDRALGALDPWLRCLGLAGRDLAPVLTGFGCKVVAVIQSRGCARCTRAACVSLMAVGSACSYQIGASLSLFGAAGREWLFLPYLGLLAMVGVLHTRLWHGTPPEHDLGSDRTFLQWPRWEAVWWRMRVALEQFLFRAMPIFLAFCLAGVVLNPSGLLAVCTRVARPVMELVGVPVEAAPAVVFAVLRKDGILLLPQDEGAVLRAMQPGLLLLVAFFASTLMACLVTLVAVRRELGTRAMFALAGRQALTATIATAALARVLAIVTW